MLKRLLVTTASLLIAAALMLIAIQTVPVQSSASGSLPQPAAPHLVPDQVISIDFGGALGETYSPAEVRISPGDSIQWLGDFAMHPLVSDDGLWQTVNAGSQFTHTFDQPGVYPYHCSTHSAFGMKGTVTVGYYGYIPLIIR
jgi:plastocyanin